MSQSQSIFRCTGFLLNESSKLYMRNFSKTSACGLKSNLPIKWNRPEKISCIRPEKSGDLEPLMKLDLSKTYPIELQDSEELRTASENVKRVFSLEYYPHTKFMEVIRDKYTASVRRHDLDVNSPEARISRMTANIRDMQDRFEKSPKNIMLKVRLKETIDKRKRLLLELREQDYKCFEYLLEKLNLEYKPCPPKTVYMRVERKRSLRMLTDEYCKNIVQTKLTDYKSTLDKQKEPFLKKKIETLKWIMKEENECGICPSVTEDDIKQVEKQLEDLLTLSKNKNDAAE